MLNKEDMDVVCVPTIIFVICCKMCHLTNKGLNKQMKAINSQNFIEALIKGVTKQTKDNKLIKRTS